MNNKTSNKKSKKTQSNLKKLKEKERNLQKKLEKCKQTKCANLYKKRIESEKIFELEQKKACSEKLSDMKYYDCTDKFYEGSTYKKIFDEFTECYNNKCKKEKKAHIKSRNNLI
jgi:hypothetical protein